MRVIGLAGSSDDDRIALAVGVASELTGRGLKVSVALRASQGFDVDRPGKDSDRHRTAGATEVMVTSANRWALIHQGAPSSEARVANLNRSLHGIKAAFGTGELGAADYHRKVADRIDAETATLSRMPSPAI